MQSQEMSHCLQLIKVTTSKKILEIDVGHFTESQTDASFIFP